MKVLIEFVIMSEATDLYEKLKCFTQIIPNCKIYYLHKGDFKKYPNGKLSKLPAKISELKIISEELDYNNTIIKMLYAYNELQNYFSSIEHDSFIDVSFFSNDMFSLEFSVEVLEYLKKFNFSLPISCYREEFNAMVQGI